MKSFKHLLNLYLICIKDSLQAIKKSPTILLGTLALIVILVVLLPVLAQLGTFGSLMFSAIAAVALSYFYSWINMLANQERLLVKELITINPPILFSLLGVLFALWIGDALFKEGFGRAPGMEWLPPIYGLAIFIIFNAIPETIQSERGDLMYSVRSALSFVQEFWIEWFLPLIILLLPIVIITSPSHVLLVVSSNYVTLPVTPILIFSYQFLKLPLFLVAIIALVLTVWYMLFRAILFSKLTSSAKFNF
jgi:hypothetical protein